MKLLMTIGYNKKTLRHVLTLSLSIKRTCSVPDQKMKKQPKLVMSTMRPWMKESLQIPLKWKWLARMRNLLLLLGNHLKRCRRIKMQVIRKKRKNTSSRRESNPAMKRDPPLIHNNQVLVNPMQLKLNHFYKQRNTAWPVQTCTVTWRKEIAFHTSTAIQKPIWISSLRIWMRPSKSLLLRLILKKSWRMLVRELVICRQWICSVFKVLLKIVTLLSSTENSKKLFLTWWTLLYSQIPTVMSATSQRGSLFLYTILMAMRSSTHSSSCRMMKVCVLQWWLMLKRVICLIWDG